MTDQIEARTVKTVLAPLVSAAALVALAPAQAGAHIVPPVQQEGTYRWVHGTRTVLRPERIGCAPVHRRSLAWCWLLPRT
jgi:hypothetical protein